MRRKIISKLFKSSKLKSKKRAIGKRAEKQACHFLQQQGLQLRTVNYYCRFGEIDLIMQDADQIVFVEVRYRQNNRYGEPTASIDEFKQRKLIKTAEIYLYSNNLTNKITCRFDVVAISSKPKGNLTIEWLKNVFMFD